MPRLTVTDDLTSRKPASYYEDSDSMMASHKNVSKETVWRYHHGASAKEKPIRKNATGEPKLE